MIYIHFVLMRIYYIIYAMQKNDLHIS